MFSGMLMLSKELITANPPAAVQSRQFQFAARRRAHLYMYFQFLACDWQVLANLGRTDQITKTVVAAKVFDFFLISFEYILTPYQQ